MEKKIVCKECSSEISAKDAFCPFCGIRIELPHGDIITAEEPQIDLEHTIVGFALEEKADSDPKTAVNQTSESFTVESGPLQHSSRTLPTVEDIDLPIEIEVGVESILSEPGPELSGQMQPSEISPAVSDDVNPLNPIEIETQPAQTPENSGLPHAEEDIFAEPPVPSVLSGQFPEAVSAFDNKSPQEMAPQEPSPEHVSSAEHNKSEAEPLEIPVFPESESVSEPEPPPVSISKPLEELPDPHQDASIFDSVRIMEGNEFALPTDADQIATMIPGVSRPVDNQQKIVSADVKVSCENEVKDTGIADSGGKRVGKLKPLPEGTILNNRYEIIRKIGGGGMGAVYLASDNNLGGVLRAVKEMVQSHIEEEQQAKAINDFKRESMILSTLDHPSIPTIYDYFFDAAEGRFYLVMKYISGGDLATRLRSAPEGRIDELTVTEWAIQITDVLNYLHNQPSTIVYRDLKPSNIMLDGNSGRVMLIDFGIARSITQKEEKGVTAVGTMGYAPPELFSGNVEPRSDIYSLGSTMFHLLTGADPQSNPLLIFDFQKNPRPRQINPRLSDQMERILMRAVEYNAEARFSSAAEMKAILEEHLFNLRSGNVTFGTGETPVAVSLANQTVFCGFCGQKIVATDLFCAFCGAKQPLAQKGVHSEIYQKPAVTARLVVEGTSDLSAPVFVLQKDENLIGRRDPVSNIFPEVDLSKYDPQTKISRRHARIWREGINFMLEDLGSSNGTSIESSGANIFRLPPRQPYKLAAGDRIRIGDARLHFIVG